MQLDLFTEHDELDLDVVLEWQHWFLVWASDSDIQSGQWLSQLVLNSLKTDLCDEVSRELSDLPTVQFVNNTMRLHHLVGGSTCPGLFRFHLQENNNKTS